MNEEKRKPKDNSPKFCLYFLLGGIGIIIMIVALVWVPSTMKDTKHIQKEQFLLESGKIRVYTIDKIPSDGQFISWEANHSIFVKLLTEENYQRQIDDKTPTYLQEEEGKTGEILLNSENEDQKYYFEFGNYPFSGNSSDVTAYYPVIAEYEGIMSYAEIYSD